MIGKTIAHYTIVEKLGEGGMGVVWKARDTHLDRFVALKLIPSEKAGDTERLRRFVKEARAASALNHSSIVHMYDIAESDGVPYIAMEYVSGKTLGEHIGQNGLRLHDALKYAAQIADALARAHAAGIAHRDLKPSNIVITDDGIAKVLDFGLAKLFERSPSTEGDLTRTVATSGGPATDEGLVMGTSAYMSPEQAEGKRVDGRSDIFSFGAVLYEMLTGRRAFERASWAATVSAVLHEEPKPLLELAPATPVELEKLITRCLRKDPDRRLSSMSDLGLALQELKAESESGPAALARNSKSTRSRRLFYATGIAVVATLACVAVINWGRNSRPRTNAPLKVVPVTTYRGTQEHPSLSPDGSQVAFSWNGSSGENFDIYVKAMGGGPPLRLTTDAAADNRPAWSPDGGSIAFLRESSPGRYSVRVMPALGGQERKVADVTISSAATLFGAYINWFPDSKALVITDEPRNGEASALFRIVINTGERQQLTFPSESFRGDSCGAVSPDGASLAFCRSSTPGIWFAEIHVASIGEDFVVDKQARQLTFDRKNVGGLAWTSDSEAVIYSSDREGEMSLWKLSRSGTGNTPSPERVEAGRAYWPSTSVRSERLAFSRGSRGDLDIWQLRLAGRRATAEPAMSPAGSTKNEFSPQYSRDGKKIVFQSNRTGNYEIWACDAEGGNCTQITALGAEYTGIPSWSPDGRQIVFYSRVAGKSQIFTIDADGGAPKRLSQAGSNYSFPRLSRDGRWIYVASDRTGTKQLWKIPVAGGSEVQLTTAGGFAGSESPDGKWLYFFKRENSGDLYRVATGGGNETRVLGSVVSLNYVVVDDGIYFTSKSGEQYSINFFDFSTRSDRVIAPIGPGYVGLTISPDERSLLYKQYGEGGSELYVVESL